MDSLTIDIDNAKRKIIPKYDSTRMHAGSHLFYDGRNAADLTWTGASVDDAMRALPDRTYALLFIFSGLLRQSGESTLRRRSKNVSVSEPILPYRNLMWDRHRCVEYLLLILLRFPSKCK